MNTRIDPPVRHIRQGIECKFKAPQKQHIMNDYYFFFSKQLKEEVEAVANEFRRMKQRKLIKTDVAILIENAYELTVPVITLELLRPSRTPRSYLNSVQELKNWTLLQRSSLDELTSTTECHVELTSSLTQLFDALDHFIEQVEMTTHSYEPGKRLPHAQTRFHVKTAIERFITETPVHSTKKKFPPYKVLYRFLAKRGLTISDRMYREYKKQLKEGTFNHYIA